MTNLSNFCLQARLFLKQLKLLPHSHCMAEGKLDQKTKHSFNPSRGQLSFMFSVRTTRAGVRKTGESLFLDRTSKLNAMPDLKTEHQNRHTNSAKGRTWHSKIDTLFSGATFSRPIGFLLVALQGFETLANTETADVEFKLKNIKMQIGKDFDKQRQKLAQKGRKSPQISYPTMHKLELTLNMSLSRNTRGILGL